MIYVASPYTSAIVGVDNKAAQQRRYEAAQLFVRFVIQTGGPAPFSPIVYCHPIAVEGNLPGDADYWYKFNMQFLRKAEALFVLMLPGWETSKGMKQEIGMAKALSMPIFHYKPVYDEKKELQGFEEVTIQ